MTKEADNSHSNHRHDSRYRAKNVVFPGSLVASEDSTEYTIRPVDVSTRGLGFLTDKPVPYGRYQLVQDDNTIEVEVIYCQPHLGIDNLYRAGLFVRSSSFDLLEYFKSIDLVLTGNTEDPF